VSVPPVIGIIALAALAPSSVTDTLFGCGVNTVALPLDAAGFPPAHADAIVSAPSAAETTA
jgi:hypothetical protein